MAYKDPTAKERYMRWYRKDPALNRARLLKRRYGITEEQYTERLDKQNGLCAICKCPPTSGGRSYILQVDHDHVTGEVRGLLCDSCNKGLGSFKENISNLESALDYLKGYWRGYVRR